MSNFIFSSLCKNPILYLNKIYETNGLLQVIDIYIGGKKGKYKIVKYYKYCRGYTFHYF